MTRATGDLTARRLLISGTGLATLFLAGAAQAADVNVYTSRQPELIQPVLDAFTEETGLSTEAIFIDSGLEQRIAAEGENSPADVIMTVDIGSLEAAKSAGVTQEVTGEAINENIPEEFQDTDHQWFGLTSRARVIYASKERVETDSLSYDDLAADEWKGRVCLRSGQHPYNVALIAAHIEHNGVDATREWLKGVRDNLARAPEGSDRAQAQAIFAGECDLALANTYYMGVMANNEDEPEQKEWAEAVKVIMPTFENGKTHVNISGIALAKHAPNRDNAVQLMNFLSSDAAQEIYAEANYEYPLKSGVEASDFVKGLGNLEPDDLALSDIAAHREEASRLVDEVAFDSGPQN